ncbi:MAG: hypothetical protein RIM84_02495 [Alphaproteobacteria bacterium]
MDDAVLELAEIGAWFETPWPWLVGTVIAIVIVLDAWDFISLKRFFGRGGDGSGGGDGGGDGGE